MRSKATVRLIGGACGLLTLMGSPQAFALDKYLELEPPKTLSGPGYGYNSIAREFVLRQCVSFAPGQLTGDSGASGDDFRFSSIISNSQLADEMDLSVTSKFSASMGVASASASSKVDFFQSTKTNFLTHTILAAYNKVDPMKYIAGDLVLKPEYLAMVGTPAFRAQCGDYVIVGEQKGRWFFGTVQLSVRDTSTESKLAANGAVDMTYGTFSAQVGVNTINKMKQASKTQDLQIHVTSSGTNSASLTIEQFLAQVQSFPGQNGPKQTYKLTAVPYEAIVANWPVTDPLAPMTAEQKLTKVAEAAWGLTALIADSDFVTQNAKLFALGTTPGKRDARLAYIKARRKFYQSQLDDMRNRAKNCDVDWNGSPACESLYSAWKDYADFAVAEYDQFPARYVSDCYASRDVSAGIQSELLTALKLEQSHFSNTKGDREMGGGPVSFSAYLSFKPDFTGGDPLGVRKLLGTLRVKMEESKADHTTFETTVKANVYDLSKPDLSQGAPMTFGQCGYRGDTGVKTDLVTIDPAACEPLKALNKPAYESCKQTIASSKYHGILSGKTGEDPRNETFNKNSRGVLASMRCMVDSDSGDDTKAIGCSNLQVRTVQLDLVNTQDVAADKWTAPPKTDIKVIPNLPKLGTAYSSVMKQLTPTKQLTPVQKLPSLQRGACAEGLVLVEGKCKLRLKR